MPVVRFSFKNPDKIIYIFTLYLFKFKKLINKYKYIKNNTDLVSVVLSYLKLKLKKIDFFYKNVKI